MSSEEAKSPVELATPTPKQRTAEATSAVENPISSTPPATLTNNLQQPISDRDPSREHVRHTLLEEELAQVREENLNLRVDLELARKRYQALESDHKECKKRKKQLGKVVKKAVKSLSTGLDRLNAGSANTGLIAEGVPDVSLPLTVQKTNASSTSGSLPVQANIFGQRSIFGASASFATPRVNNPVPTVFGGPKATVQPLEPTKSLLRSTPGSDNDQEQSSEQAKSSRNEMFNYKFVPLGWPGPFDNRGPYERVSLFTPYHQSKKRKIGEEAGGGRGGQSPGIVDTAAANKERSSKPEGSEGAGTGNETLGNGDTDMAKSQLQQ